MGRQVPLRLELLVLVEVVPIVRSYDKLKHGVGLIAGDPEGRTVHLSVLPSVLCVDQSELPVPTPALEVDFKLARRCADLHA